jgi:hypothetical protein
MKRVSQHLDLSCPANYLGVRVTDSNVITGQMFVVIFKIAIYALLLGKDHSLPSSPPSTSSVLESIWARLSW